jgi:magnesium transporter
VGLFRGEMLTATSTGYFEGELGKVIVLSPFIPLVTSSGGDAGSQATTLVMRALAQGEFKLRDGSKIMGHELAAGPALGLILGAVAFFAGRGGGDVLRRL